MNVKYLYPRLFIIILLCSSSSLAYEIALTRIFSISLWYHFAFMIISIAMLGIGTSGTVLYLYPKLKNLSYIGTYSLLLGIGISLSYLISNQIPFDPVKLSWSKMQILYIGIYYITLSIPFFFMGLIIATALSSLGKNSGLFYSADLIGAGLGSIGVLYAMTLSAPDKTVFILSSIALSSAFLAGGIRLKIVSSFLTLLTLSLFVFNPDFIELKMSPYKGLQTAMRYPGAEHLKTYFSPYSRIDTFKSPAVRFAPGISLRYLDMLPEQTGFSIDGGEINAITAYKDRASLKFTKYLPSALPYEISNPHFGTKGLMVFSDKLSKPQDILIIDPRGGLQCLIAQYYDSLNIYKTESNPLLVKIIDKDFNTFSGGIYSQNTWTGLARSWLKFSGKKFDIIDVPLMGTAPSGSFGISEDYRFTVEAFKEYLIHLKPEGFLSLNLFILPPPRIELRILSTAIKSMEELGITNIENHVAAIRSWGSICIMFKKSPFSFQEIKAIKSFSKDLRFDLIHYPGIQEKETNLYVRMQTNEYFTAFMNILDHKKRNQFINTYVFDVNPVRDDNPFFHYYLKLKNTGEIYKIMGRKWQYFIEEGYILPLVFVQVLLLSFILVILPVIKYGKAEAEIRVNSKNNYSLKFLPYFAFLGLGFMFVEVSLIQKMILPLENPPYAVATVLTSLLISSGIGSLSSYKIPVLRNPLTIMVTSLFIFAYSMLLPDISNIISPYPVTVKIFLVFFVFLPLGLLMGIPFPAGLRILSEKNESLVPWAWAINGCLSVLAPILTVMFAMVIGFQIVLWAGALTYMMAFLTMKMFLRKSF